MESRSYKKPQVRPLGQLKTITLASAAGTNPDPNSNGNP